MRNKCEDVLARVSKNKGITIYRISKHVFYVDNNNNEIMTLSALISED